MAHREFAKPEIFRYAHRERQRRAGRDVLRNKRINDVFISYSHENADRAAPIVKWMQSTAGLRVW